MLRKLSLVLAFLLVPVGASADAHRAGLFGGYSALKGSTLHGFHLSGDIVFGDLETSTPDWWKTVSVAGEFTRHKAEGADDAFKTASVGIMKRFARQAPSPHVGSVHALFGKAFGGGDSTFVTTLGGSYELIWDRDERTQWGVGVQLDGVLPKEGDKFFRVSIGGIFRFK